MRRPAIMPLLLLPPLLLLMAAAGQATECSGAVPGVGPTPSPAPGPPPGARAAAFLTDENPLGAPLPSFTVSGAPGAATVALGSAAPSYTPYPAYQGYTHALAAPAPVYALRTQFHAQDELGQGVYGHVEPFQAHAALQDASGGKVGSFSYVGPDGRVVRTDYVADSGGFRAASDALPTAPPPTTDTPEVAAARQRHLAAHRPRRARAARPRPPPRQRDYDADAQVAGGDAGPALLLAQGPGFVHVAAYRPATLSTVAAGQSLLYRVD